jgi:hypothetical protein
LIYDITTNELIQKYVFDEELAPLNNSFLVREIILELQYYIYEYYSVDIESPIKSSLLP